MSAEENRSVRLWQWPTVLSLDAPAVAFVWQSLLARTAQVRLAWTEQAVLAASVWLAYAADRWIEGWRLDPRQIRTQRHAFYQRHRWGIACVWGIVLGSAVTLSVLSLSAKAWIEGMILLSAVLAYLLSHQLIHRGNPWRAPKEVCVAALLSGGVALFITARPGANLEALAAPLCLFAFLCFANCALISVWESEVDLSHGQTSLALQLSEAEGLAKTLPLILIGASAAVAYFQPGARPAAISAAASSLLLYVVDRFQLRMGRRLSRVLADAVLLTPVVPLLLLR